ncbi:MAG: hypothetical protein ACR2N8_04455 [Parvibaculales bacterium]
MRKMREIRIFGVALVVMVMSVGVAKADFLADLFSGENYQVVRGGVLSADDGTEGYSADVSPYLAYAVGLQNPNNRIEFEVGFAQVIGEGSVTFAGADYAGGYTAGTDPSPATLDEGTSETISGDMSENSVSLMVNYFHEFALGDIIGLGSGSKVFVGAGFGLIFGGDGRTRLRAEELYDVAPGNLAAHNTPDPLGLYPRPAARVENGFEDGLTGHVSVGFHYGPVELQLRQYLGDQGLRFTVGYRF